MLSKTHETTLTIPVNYKNNPADLIQLNTPIDFINARVKSPGFSILFFHFFNYNTLTFDYNVANSKPLKSGKNLFWILNSKRQKVANILGNSMEILTLSPERLVIPFSNKNKKEVTIQLKKDITLKKEYWLSSEIEINPKTITIYGDQKLLDSITEISTELLKLDGIFENITTNISLEMPEGVQCKIAEAEVTLNVAQFVEESIIQKVEVLNLAEGYSLKLFPNVVTATVRLPKDKYNFLKTGFLKLEVDASILDDSKNRLEIQVKNLPSFIKLKRLYPQQVEFLLIKN